MSLGFGRGSPFFGYIDLRDISSIRNVKDFGAVGDGTTDDTAAIQAALDDLPVGPGYPNWPSGGIVYAPGGRYHITAPLSFNTYYTMLIGAGHSTYLEFTDDWAGGATMLDTYAGGSHCHLRHMRIGGDIAARVGPTTRIIYMGTEDYLYDVWVERAKCPRFVDVIGSNAWIDHCVLYANGQTGGGSVWIQATADYLTIRDTWFGTLENQVIYCAADNCKFIGNKFYDNLANIRIILANRCIVTDNEFYQCDEHGIILEGAQRSIIGDNIIQDVGMKTDDTYDAIRLLSSGGTHSIRNNIHDNQILSGQANKHRYGIREDDANQDYNMIHHNNVTDAQTASISKQGPNTDMNHNLV